MKYEVTITVRIDDDGVKDQTDALRYVREELEGGHFIDVFSNGEIEIDPLHGSSRNSEWHKLDYLSSIKTYTRRVQ